MKPLLCLFCLFFLLGTFPVHATDIPKSNLLTFDKAKKLPPITPEQLDEAFAITDQCKAYTYTNTLYNCDCMGLKFLNLRRSKGDAADAFWLKETAKKFCANKTEIAGSFYTRCMTWAPESRGEDAESFCACYATNFSKIFAKAPSENQLIREAQMTKAMSMCDPSAPDKRNKEMRAMIDDIKRKGQYEKLFPGASEKQITPNGPPPASQSPHNP